MENITTQEALFNIGKKVYKHKSGKPFKSGFKINTIKGVIKHPKLNIPAYTFEEDDSYVDVRVCKILNKFSVEDLSNINFTLNDILNAAQYGFGYAIDSQHNGEFVPKGNILQWLLSYKNLE